MGLYEVRPLSLLGTRWADRLRVRGRDERRQDMLDVQTQGAKAEWICRTTLIRRKRR